MIAATPAPIAVCGECAVTRLQDALNHARSGATIVVHGTQYGNFTIRRSVTLEGAPDGVLDGRGRGTVLTIQAPHVAVRALRVRNSGTDFVAMDSAIRSNAPYTTIENIRVDGSLFGIYFAKADESSIVGSRIDGLADRAVPDRGDGLRIWYSRDVRVDGNTVSGARDDLFWFSQNLTVAHNTVSGGRYGIHTMYSDGMVVDSNVVRDCEVGSYAMYGRRVRIERNVFSGNRGSTGYGIGLKDMDYTSVTGNALVSNHTGIYVDDSPSLVGSTLRISGNMFAYNEIGFAALPSAHDDLLTQNTFADNYRQISVLGGGALAHIAWTHNYWSDYAGFDRDGNGIGDIRYTPNDAYGTLADLDEDLNLLAYSPAAKAIDFAADALPLFKQAPVLEDKAPLMYPVYPQRLASPSRSGSRASSLSMGALALAAAFGLLLPFRPRSRKREERTRSAHPAAAAGGAAILARGLRKRYGTTLALDGIDLEVARGETVGLWGPNGSGKSTLMRCLLGILEFDGDVSASVPFGYVPQALPAFDMRVREFAAFVGGLRGCAAREAGDALRDADLFDLAARNVNELSGGQRQRLGVAVAALGNPGALLLDEPTVGLDARSRRAILRFLCALKRKGTAIVISSHVPDDLTALADRILVIEEGRIRANLSPAQFGSFVRERREEAS